MKDTAGATHLSHIAAPGAAEYNGHAIHVKGAKRKLEKLVKKATKAAADHDHGHDHAHDHAGHNH